VLSATELGRLFHTVRYLEPVQVVDRVCRRLLPLRVIPQVEGTYACGVRAAVPPAVARDDGFDGRTFGFLNRRLAFSGPERWEPRGAERLWTSQLHCFRFLHGIPESDALDLVLDWIEANRNPRGPGWEPYPLSLRIREWIEWLVGRPDLDEGRRSVVLRSLAEQARALDAQLEYHLLGNHLLENGITLTWAGLSLRGPHSARWLRSGLRVLEQELPRQVLADGTHYERSPMYQAFIAESLARLGCVAATSDGPAAARVRELVEPAATRLIDSLAWQVHPDGDYALFNDCALGQAPTLGDLRRAWPEKPAAPEPTGPEGTKPQWSLPNGGYFGVRTTGGMYLAVDVGRIGPDHQPGHGHASALSFELSHRARRLVTDTGVYTYAPGDLRARDRSTAAHNTIEVNGRDQSELWSAFRCGRRIRITGAGIEGHGGSAFLHGEYVGPGRRSVRVRHRRTFAFANGGLFVRDRLEAAGRHQATIRLHLAPGLEVRRNGVGLVITEGRAQLACLSAPHLEWRVESSPYHPEFGLEEERICLRASMEFDEAAEAVWVMHLR
jgi:uncharacterized heparinase superfamily protein